jgi:hypothetical protein
MTMGLRIRSLFAAAFVLGVITCEVCGSEELKKAICKPNLQQLSTITLGSAGQFSWDCPEPGRQGNGYFIVFVRPVGTYVLLKVPEQRTAFEFAPDMPGNWRWIVINTDPDRGQPDVESDPGYFQVTAPEESAH